MTDYLLPPFGQINLSSVNEYYEAEIESEGKQIRLDLNLAKTAIKEDAMDTIRHFIENINNFDITNKSYIDKDYNDENGDTVKEYIDFHIEELGEDKLAQLIDYDNKEITPEKQLLKKLTLERVGLYPDGKYDTQYFAVFDYTFEGNVYSIDGRRTITDQIIAVKTDNRGNLDHLAWES